MTYKYEKSGKPFIALVSFNNIKRTPTKGDLHLVESFTYATATDLGPLPFRLQDEPMLDFSKISSASRYYLPPLDERHPLVKKMESAMIHLDSLIDRSPKFNYSRLDPQ